MKNSFLFIFIFINSIIGGELADSALTIERALDIAKVNNPQINQIRQQIESKNAEWWGGFGIDDPQLSYMQEGIDYNTNQGFIEKRYGISQSIDFPLTTYFRLKRINHEENALEKAYQQECLNLKAHIKSLYTELMYTQEILHLRESQLNLAVNLQNSALTRVEVGESSQLDLIKAEIQKAEAENDLEEARQAYDEARYSLFRVIGLDPKKQKYALKFPDSLAYVDIQIDQKEALLYLKNQPRFRAASKQLDAANQNVNAAWSSLLPRIDLSYYRQDLALTNGYDFYGYEVGLNIPLWFMFNQRGTIQKAKAERNIIRWQRNEVELEAKKQVEIAWHSFDRSKKIIERFHSVIREKSFQLRDLTTQGYEMGELNLLALLESQRTYLNSEKHYLDILKEYYLRVIELERVLQKDLILNTQTSKCL